MGPAMRWTPRPIGPHTLEHDPGCSWSEWAHALVDDADLRDELTHHCAAHAGIFWECLPTARHLLKQISGEANLSEIKIDKESAKVLKNYAWPGNVRELLNVLERTMPALVGDTIGLENLPFYLHHNRQRLTDQYRSSLKDVQATTEKDAICRALQDSGNNKAKAARMLGIHRTQLYKKLKKFNLPL